MILLDTHVWIWLASDPEKLSIAARKKISGTKKKGISAISCWEFATLVHKGRVSLDRSPLEWMEQSFEELGIELIPLTPSIAVRSTQLGRNFQGDPADRLILATALVLSAPLVTKDERIRGFSGVETIW